MNIIEETTTKVVYMVYDSENDCCRVSLDKSILVPVAYGMNIQYQRRGSLFVELTTVDCSDLKVGDTITVRTIERLPGEQIKLFGGEYYTFSSAGISNIIVDIKKK